MSVNYMLISIIILAVAIAIPFFTFEKRKPKARHVVMIAVMSALTVVQCDNLVADHNCGCVVEGFAVGRNGNYGVSHFAEQCFYLQTLVFDER